MSRAVRWQFALPWVLLLMAVLVVAQVVLARLARVEVREAGENSIGAKVDVGDAYVSFLGRRLTLENIAVTNPKAPLRNLIEVERCDLYADASALLYKHTVIDRGELTGIRFGTERTESGVLETPEDPDRPSFTWLDSEAAETAEAWLARLKDKFTVDLMEQLESIRLTEELLAHWPEKHAVLEARVTKLRKRAAEFQESVKLAQSNPLRHVKFLDAMPDAVTQIRDELAELTRHIEELPGTVEIERRAIISARQHDEKFLYDQFRFERVDGNALTAYLLQKQLGGPLADLMGWLEWMRRVMPAEPRTTVARHRRGDEVIFPGCRAAPDLLIRELSLRGSAQFAGRRFELLGSITDFASQPRLHDQPLRVKLTTAGSLPLELQATIDRTGPVARDQLLVDCGILLPKLRLGRSDAIELTLEPTDATLNVSLTLEGDRLSGDIQIVQKHVRVTPTVVAELAKTGVGEALGECLTAIDSLATRVSLGGTLAEPKCQVWSNVGTAVAEALERALDRTREPFCKQLLAQAQQRVDERLAQLDRQIAEGQEAISPQLALSNGAIEAIAEGQRPLRISLEDLGRRLPADSLFR